MTDIPASDPAHPISPLACVAGVFYRPSRTFESLSQCSSWWIPFLIALFLFCPFYFRDLRNFDFHQVMEQKLHQGAPEPQALERLTPAQLTRVTAMINAAVRYSWLDAPLLFLFYAALEAAILLSVINLGFGGRASFRQIYSIVWYARLPEMLAYLPMLALPFYRDQSHPTAGQLLQFTSLGYYLNLTAMPRIVSTIFGFLDPWPIWTAALLGIGLSIVAQTRRRQGFIVAAIWWITRWFVFTVFFVLITLIALFAIVPFVATAG